MREGHLIGGRYRLGVQLGRGGMGRVFRATDERLRRDVAIKIVDLSQTTDKTLGERFHREAIATAKLNHPGIVTIYDSGTDGRLAYLVMELLGGRPVADILRDQGRLSQAETVRIGRRVAEALVATHAIGIVHRDLKPANIMVDGPSVKLLDFGIAMVSLDAESNLTAPATALGTAAYMSPEQAQGFRASPASDVYGLGGVLVSMLTGQPPYEGDNAIQVANRHLSEPAPSVRSRVPGISVALDDLVTRMMAKDAASRPTASLVAAALAHLEENPSAATTTVFPAAPVNPAVPPASAPVQPGVLPAAAAMGIAAAAAAAAPAPARPMLWTPGSPAPTAVQPAATRIEPAATRAEPAVRAEPPATLVQPAVTAQFPPGPILPSAQRAGAPADPGRSMPPPDAHLFRTLFGRLGILIGAMMVFGLAWAVGTNVIRNIPRPTMPFGIGETVQTDGDESLLGLPGLPSAGDLTLLAGIAGVDAALATLPTDTPAAQKTTKALKERWASTADDLRAGKNPKTALKNFRNQVDRRANAGDISAVEAGVISVALSALEVAV